MARCPNNKPNRPISAYEFFLKAVREEHIQRHPEDNSDSVYFDSELTRRCGNKWQSMAEIDKKSFEDMAQRDNGRFQLEMLNYDEQPCSTTSIKECKLNERGYKRKKNENKDPHRPKRATTSFFYFTYDKRPKIRREHPDWSIPEVAKEIGRLWENLSDKSKYERLAEMDKERYDEQINAYNIHNVSGKVPNNNEDVQRDTSLQGSSNYKFKNNNEMLGGGDAIVGSSTSDYGFSDGGFHLHNASENIEGHELNYKEIEGAILGDQLNLFNEEEFFNGPELLCYSQGTSHATTTPSDIMRRNDYEYIRGPPPLPALTEMNTYTGVVNNDPFFIANQRFSRYYGHNAK